MLDDRVRAVLDRLEREDADDRARPAERRAGARGHTGDGTLPLRARVAAGGLRGAQDRRLSRLLVDLARGGRAGARRAGALPRERSEEGRGRRRNIAEAGLEDWAELVEGDAAATLAGVEDVFDVVFIDGGEKEDYEAFFALARDRVEPGALIVGDNVVSHPDPLARYSAARQSDPTLVSVTVPLDRGLELSVVLG